MNNRVPEVFLSEMFGELRIMKDDNKFYFCAADVCSALGYSNPSHELNIHCRHDGIKAGRTDVNGVPRIIKFIIASFAAPTNPKRKSLRPGFLTNSCPGFARPAVM